MTSESKDKPPGPPPPDLPSASLFLAGLIGGPAVLTLFTYLSFRASGASSPAADLGWCGLLTVPLGLLYGPQTALLVARWVFAAPRNNTPSHPASSRYCPSVAAGHDSFWRRCFSLRGSGWFTRCCTPAR